MIKNKVASIFVYILFLVTIGVTISVILLSNISFLTNYSLFSRTELSFLSNIKKSSDLYIDTHKFFNSNGSGFIDTKSCPQNVTLSGTTQSGIVNTTLSYSGGLFSCNATYNGKDIKINLDSNYNFENVSFSGQTINLNSNNSWGANVPSVAYGLRRLSDSYSGALIKVRRSNDNALLDIGFTSTGGLDTVSLLNFASGSISAFVHTWFDQSGNGLNATQTTTSNQPRIVNSGVLERVNGQPVIRYTVEGQTLTTSSRVFDSMRDNFVNIAYNASDGSKTPFSGNGGVSQTERFTFQSHVVFDYSTNFSTYGRLSYPATPTNFKINNFYHSTTNNFRYISENGIIRTQSTASSTGNYTNGTIQVGAVVFPSPWKFEGTIGELIVYSSKLPSSGDIKLFEQSQSKYFQLPISGGIVPNNSHMFSFSDTDSTFMTFSMPENIGDNIDDNFNSDNYRVTSTGTTSTGVYYPGNFQDDDVFVRKNIFGYIDEKNIFKSIFWHNTRTSKFIDRNTNNNDNLNIKIGNSTSGVLNFDFSGPYSLKILELDRQSFLNSGEFKILNKYDFSGNTGSGYLQNNGSLTGTLTGNEIKFNFSTKDYAIFLQNTGTGTLRYNLKSIQDTKEIYINPLDDSYLNEIRYLGNDIIIENGIYKHKHKEIIYKK